MKLRLVPITHKGMVLSYTQNKLSTEMMNEGLPSEDFMEVIDDFYNSWFVKLSPEEKTRYNEDTFIEYERLMVGHSLIPTDREERLSLNVHKIEGIVDLDRGALFSFDGDLIEEIINLEEMVRLQRITIGRYSMALDIIDEKKSNQRKS